MRGRTLQLYPCVDGSLSVKILRSSYVPSSFLPTAVCHVSLTLRRHMPFAFRVTKYIHVLQACMMYHVCTSTCYFVQLCTVLGTTGAAYLTVPRRSFRHSGPTEHRGRCGLLGKLCVRTNRGLATRDGVRVTGAETDIGGSTPGILSLHDWSCCRNRLGADDWWLEIEDMSLFGFRVRSWGSGAEVEKLLSLRSTNS